MAEWQERGGVSRLGEVISALGTPRFDGAVHSLASSFLLAEHVDSHLYPKHGQPRNILAFSLRPEVVPHMSTAGKTYLTEYVRENGIPRYGRHKRPFMTVESLQEVPPNRADRPYWDILRSTHRLKIFGRVDGDLCDFCISLRSEGAFLDKSVVQPLLENAEILLKLIHKHDQIVVAAKWTRSLKDILVGGSADERIGRLRLIADILVARTELSEREADVCAGVIAGYSNEAIGLNLKISPHTVVSHRRRAYHKLNISSQAELFATLCDVALVGAG